MELVSKVRRLSRTGGYVTASGPAARLDRRKGLRPATHQRPARAKDIRHGGGEHEHGFEHWRAKVAPSERVPIALARVVAGVTLGGMRNSWEPLSWFVVGGAAAVIGACGSTAMVVGDAGQADATADHESPSSIESDAASTDATATDGGPSAEALDAAVVIIPCSVGNAFLTCTLPGGGECECLSDVSTCNSFCDAAGCEDPCADASCTNRCASDQMAMGCGGPPRPLPPAGDDAAPRVSYVYADPPDGCAVAPGGITDSGLLFYCCPRALADR